MTIVFRRVSKLSGGRRLRHPSRVALVAADRSLQSTDAIELVTTTLLLVASIVFMTFAWYAHLRNMADCRYPRTGSAPRPSRWRN